MHQLREAVDHATIGVEGIDTFHGEKGKITELWLTVDDLGVLPTMGDVPVGEAGRPLAMA